MSSSTSSSSDLEVEGQDIIRLILQFCKENSLLRTFATLQDESGVCLNTVDSVESFMGDILSGRWDAVLSHMGNLKLHTSKLINLYEQVVLELLELHETDTARAILRSAPALQTLKHEDPERYLRMEHMMNRPIFDQREAYPDGGSKESRRAQIANELASAVTVVPPSRLLFLIGQALKWQQHQGLLPPGTKFDVFRGQAASQGDEEDLYPVTLENTVQFGEKSYAESVVFSPDGQFLATGSIDGFIEIWDYETGRIKSDLAYQAEDAFMMHETAVLTLDFSRDSDYLASGCANGKIKVWKVRTGQCLRRFEHAHAEGVTCVKFDRTGTKVLSCSFDGLIRLHGLKSGRTLKEFRGHTSFVNAVSFSLDENHVISGSSDGSVRVWDIRTSEEIQSFKPPHLNPHIELSVHSVVQLPKQVDQILIGARNNSCHITNLQGKVIRTMNSGKANGGDFVEVTVSPRGAWIYGVAEDRTLYCFSTATGKLEHVMKLHDADVIAIACHPHRNIMASVSVDGTLKVWKAESLVD